MRPIRRELQAVFQDPYSSLNPRMRAADIVVEPVRNYESLPAAAAARARRGAVRPRRPAARPARQATRTSSRAGSGSALGIARALSVRPRLIVCDEPVSALDVSVQAQVINLLMDLQEEFHLSYLFIAHDLAVVEHISHRVAVMYLGKIVEIAPTRSIFAQPLHPYTEALLESVPVPDPAMHEAAPRSRRRRAEPRRPAVGMPLPHALPVRREPLPPRGAAVASGGARAPRRVPPAGRAMSAPGRPPSANSPPRGAAQRRQPQACGRRP